MTMPRCLPSGQKSPFVKKEDGETTAFQIIPTLLGSIVQIGTAMVVAAISRQQHKLLSQSVSSQNTQAPDGFQIKKDVQHGNE